MKATCPSCETVNDVHFGPDAVKPPEDGDFSLCMSCYEIGIFEDGVVRKATEEETERILALPDIQEAIEIVRQTNTPLEAAIKRWAENMP